MTLPRNKLQLKIDIFTAHCKLLKKTSIQHEVWLHACKIKITQDYAIIQDLPMILFISFFTNSIHPVIVSLLWRYFNKE